MARRWNGPERVPADLDTPGRLALLEQTIAEAWLWGSVRSLVRDCHELAVRRAAARPGLSLAEAVADVAMQLTQRCGYRSDPPNADTYQGLSYTIFRGGDCEDLSALFVGLVRCVAHRYGVAVWARVAWFPRPQSDQDHVTAEVRCGPAGAPWQWAECSIEGAARGEYPPAAAARLARHRGDVLGVVGGV